jgi:hypothetical protein
LARDFFLFAGNITGLIVSIWYNLSASNLLFKQQVAQLPDVINVVDLDERSGDTATMNGRAAHQMEKDVERQAPPGSPNKYRPPQARMSAIDEDQVRQDSNIPQALDEGARSMDESDKQAVKEIDYSGRTNDTKAPLPITELPVFYTPPTHDYRVMAMALLWIIIFSILGFGEFITPYGRELIVGVTTNLCLVFFYGAPLSSIAIVLRTHNTATLHVPTMFTNTASSVFWGIYGLAVMDFFVMVPNLLGACLGLAQIALYLTYPRQEMITVPVITAAIPTGGGEIGDGSTEMEVVQLQLHDILAPTAGVDLLHNTGINDTLNNPLNVEYTIPTDEDGNVDPHVTTLHKRQISLDGVSGVHVSTLENPLVLQYTGGPGVPTMSDGDSVVSPSTPIPSSSDLVLENPAPSIGLLHRRQSSRNGGVISGISARDAFNEAGIPAVNTTVASVHHRRVPSNTDNVFSLAGIFAGNTDATTTTATLHRRVLSSNMDGNQHQD